MIADLHFTLHNVPGTLTHFPCNNYRHSIPNLTLSRGHVNSGIQGWSAETLGSGDWNHALITILINITVPTFTPRRVHRLTDWAKFEQTIQEPTFPVSRWDHTQSTLDTAVDPDACLQRAINKAVPWSTPSNYFRRWWTPEISQVKKTLAHVRRCVRMDNYLEESKEIDQHCWTKWEQAI